MIPRPRSPRRTRHGQSIPAIETEQIGIDGEEVGVEFLDLSDFFVWIVFGEEVEEGRGDYAREEEVVFREARVGELVDEQADVDFGGAEEADRFHVADVGGSFFLKGEGVGDGGSGIGCGG